MSTHIISNEKLTATVQSLGAELISLKNREGKEYIFRDSSYWSFSSPILFPICGGLKDDKFIYNGKEYSLQKHGYVRFDEFQVEKSTPTEIAFSITHNEMTKKVYPFEYKLTISYRLEDASLVVDYSVENLTDGKMYYSIGCHEAYLCPEGIDGYKLTFDKTETLNSHKVIGNLVSHETDEILSSSQTLVLDYKYFEVDALVFSSIASQSVVLSSPNACRKIKVAFPGFNRLLLWTPSKKNAPFICIEPWQGFPDFVDSSFDITKRCGIICLEKGKSRVDTHIITPLE